MLLRPPENPCYGVYTDHRTGIVICDAGTGLVYAPSFVQATEPDAGTKFFGPFDRAKIVYLKLAAGASNPSLEDDLRVLPPEDSRRVREALTWYNQDPAACLQHAHDNHDDIHLARNAAVFDNALIDAMHASSRGGGGIDPKCTGMRNLCDDAVSHPERGSRLLARDLPAGPCNLG
ncbi:MAG: hypothetical protein AB7H77_09730 [Bdellovibrionales bacterium]